MSERHDAELDYKKGMSLADIAKKYGKTQATVRKWKSRYKWDSVTDKRDSVTKSVTSKKVIKEITKVIDEADITDKQKLFVTQYLKNYNATQAYINAYEVKYDVARTAGPRLLQNVGVQKAIKLARETQLNSINIDINDLITDLAATARSDIGDYLNFASHDELMTDGEGNPIVDVDGNPVTKHYSQVWVKDKSEVDTSLIKEVSVGKDGVQLKLHDKERARDMLLKQINEQRLLDAQIKKLEAEAELARWKMQQTTNPTAGLENVQIVDDIGGDDEN